MEKDVESSVIKIESSINIIDEKRYQQLKKNCAKLMIILA